MKSDIRAISAQLAGLAGVALGSFLGTMFALIIAGLILAPLSFDVLREHWFAGLIAAVVALFEAMATGIVLGVKRAVVMSLAHGLGELRLGALMVRQVFGRMLGITGDGEFGERGVPVAQGLERLPLAQAEQRLSDAVRQVLGDAQQVGWLRRKIQTALLRALEKYTLARFREEGAQHGGVNLLKVKEELEATVDSALVKKVRGGLRIWTVLAIIGLPSAIVTQTYAIMMLVR